MSTTIPQSRDAGATPASPPGKRFGWLKAVLIAGVAGMAVFLGVVAVQPDDYRIERSATFNAPATVVFDTVNNFHNWEAWSPWAKLDPNAKNTFEGPDSGEGAIFKWDGNDQVGAGQLTILESRPNELIRMKLEFFRPMEDSCITQFSLDPQGAQTEVRWSMLGTHPSFVSKAFCFVMNIDKMVGTDFEKGLANMKVVVERTL